MANLRHPLILLPSLIFLLPLNIYVIGDRLGAGIQWALFRYQFTIGGESLISAARDAAFVLAGTISGKSGLAISLWSLSAALLLAYFVLTLWAVLSERESAIRAGGLILITCAILFLVSAMIQYGLFLHGAGGWCIPVGIPLLVVLGIWVCSGGSLVPPADRTPAGLHSPARADCLSRLSTWYASVRNRELVTLVLLSLIVQVIAFFFWLLPNLPLTVVLGDTRLYYWYATSLSWGQIPYSSYYVPYPQFFFLPVLAALIPTLGSVNYTGYLYSYSALMIVINTATLVLVYSIAERLWDQRKAFVCGFLYSTAISAAFFVPIYYDAVPSFLLLLSLWMYLYRSQVAGFLLATAGFLTKWYPLICLPYYILHGMKTGKKVTDFKKPVLLSGLLVLITVVPFLILNSREFLNTYLIHIGRAPEVNSFVYYADAVFSFLSGHKPFGGISLLVLVVLELLLLWWYYRSSGSRPQTLIGCIFLGIFIFVLFNKVFSTNYILWLAPFLALFLSGSNRNILLFYLVQVVLYLETPVLFGVVYAPLTFGPSGGSSYLVLENSLPSFSFLFYTIKFAILIAVFSVVAKDLIKDTSGPDAGAAST